MLSLSHRLRLAVVVGLACLAILAASSCGAKVVFDPPAPACPGSGGGGGATGAGGAGACTEVSGLCQAWCAGRGAKEEGDSCLADCLGFYEGFYPDCAGAYAANLACKVQHMNNPAGCSGLPAACRATDDALGACGQAHPACDGFGCEGCNCKTTCSTVFESSYADGTYTCTMGGTVVGTCAEKCFSATMAKCCAELFFKTCPP